MINEYYQLEGFGKVEFLKRIEFEDNDAKWDLFLKIIQDEEDYDLARMEAFKILEISNIPNQVKDEIMPALIKTISTTTDDDIKNYAASALSNFIEYPEIRTLAAALVLDKNEDIDIRYNAFAAIRKYPDIQERDSILESLLQDDDFKKSAQRIITEGR